MALGIEMQKRVEKSPAARVAAAKVSVAKPLKPPPVEEVGDLRPAAQSSGSTLGPEGRRILEAIEELPEDEREVFGLVRIQGLTQVEAAEILGVSAKTVQRRLNRGLFLLGQRLDDLRPGGEPLGP